MTFMRMLRKTFSREQAEELGLRLRTRAEALEISGTALAQALGSSQPRISRLFGGHFSRRTPLLERVCAHLGVNSRAVASPASQLSGLPPALRKALALTWDGSQEGARELADLIIVASRCSSTSRRRISGARAAASRRR